jgi:hypothetical protein
LLDKWRENYKRLEKLNVLAYANRECRPPAVGQGMPNFEGILLTFEIRHATFAIRHSHFNVDGGQSTLVYSYFSVCAGFIRAARIVWKLTDKKAMITTPIPAMINKTGLISM